MITQTDKAAIGRYIAYLAQVGTATPTATVLYNTIGTINISRLSTGRYILTSPQGLFTIGKTIVNNCFSDNAAPIMLATSSAYTYLVQTNPNLGAFTIEIAILDATTLAYTDLSTVGAITIPVNIEIYNYITPTQS